MSFFPKTFIRVSDCYIVVSNSIFLKYLPHLLFELVKSTMSCSRNHWLGVIWKVDCSGVFIDVTLQQMQEMTYVSLILIKFLCVLQCTSSKTQSMLGNLIHSFEATVWETILLRFRVSFNSNLCSDSISKTSVLLILFRFCWNYFWYSL